ncbi:MAG: WhiB family transcriptional regulator [Actinomycetota bacterium]|nr:WhiB family transcriptional regulator [Actinomycetota bacterium]
MYGDERGAMELCSRCPVRELCLWSTLTSEEAGSRFGVSGGTTPTQRERLAEDLTPEMARRGYVDAMRRWSGTKALCPSSPTQGDGPAVRALAELAYELGVSPTALQGPGQGRRLVDARQLAMYVLHEGLGLSYSEIGRTLGRDHTTVIHGVARVAARAGASHCERDQVARLVRLVRIVRDHGGVPDVGVAALARVALVATGTTAAPRRRRRRDACDEDSLAARTALRVVAEDYGLAVADLTGKGRGAQLVEARQAAMYVLHHAAGLRYPGVGRALGGRDNATARHGVARAAALAAGSTAARRRLDDLCGRVATDVAAPRSAAACAA